MSLFGELKRRNVFRVGIAYVVTTWIIIQVADTLNSMLGLPEWAPKLVLLILLIGFLPALVFAWAFELTPEGIQRESEIDRTQSVSRETGKRLNRAILILLALAVAYLLFDKFWESPWQNPGASSHDPEPVMAGDGAQQAAAPASDSDELISRQSIAVLPFENRSMLAEDVFFVQGIHDDLLTKLARIGGIKVISRTTVSQFTDTEKTLPQIARELNVAHVMEGSVQRAGDTVRINVQLIRADADDHVWAQAFDRQLTAENLFRIQTEISEHIAETLESTLSAEERQRIDERPTDNLAAYNAYLRGRQALSLNSSEGADRALVEFRRATELDPDFALAWVGLAFSAGQGFSFSDMDMDETLQITREGVNRALELDDQLGEAHLAQADLIRREQGSWMPEYEQALTRAIELSPGLADAWIRYAAHLAPHPDRADEALFAAEKASELDPLSNSVQTQMVWILGRLGRFEEAEARLQQLIQMNERFALNYSTLSQMKFAQGQLADSLYWLREAQKRDPGNIVFQLAEVWTLTSLRLEDEYEDLIARVERLDPASTTLAMVESVLYLSQGKLEAALAAAKAWVERTGEGHGRTRASALGWQSTVHSYRGEYADAMALLSEAGFSAASPESLLGMARDAPRRACIFAWVIHSELDTSLAENISREAIGHTLTRRPHEQRRRGMDLIQCHMVLGDFDGALSRMEQAIEDGQLGAWWLPISHPMFDILRMEPRFLDIKQRIDRDITAQRDEFIGLTREKGRE